MERGSAKHNPRIDEQLEHDTRSMLQGAPVESRADEAREQEGPADGEPTPDARLAGDRGLATSFAPPADEIEARTELARHLEPSVFPAGREALMDSASRMHAPDSVLEQLRRLPEGVFGNVGEAWAALGGLVEHRPEASAPSEPPPPADQPQVAGRSEPRSPRRFGFVFDRRFEVAGRVFGVSPERASVEVGDGRLTARFGPWRVETTTANVISAHVSGPFAWWKVIGPPHFSPADRGITFATNNQRGVCIEFREPVAGLEPTGRVRHPNLTVTVDDPEALVAALTG